MSASNGMNCPGNARRVERSPSGRKTLRHSVKRRQDGPFQSAKKQIQSSADVHCIFARSRRLRDFILSTSSRPGHRRPIAPSVINLSLDPASATRQNTRRDRETPQRASIAIIFHATPLALATGVPRSGCSRRGPRRRPLRTRLVGDILGVSLRSLRCPPQAPLSFRRRLCVLPLSRPPAIGRLELARLVADSHPKDCGPRSRQSKRLAILRGRWLAAVSPAELGRVSERGRAAVAAASYPTRRCRCCCAQRRGPVRHSSIATRGWRGFAPAAAAPITAMQLSS